MLKPFRTSPVRAAAILTTDYVYYTIENTENLPIQEYQQMTLKCGFTKGGSSGISITVETKDMEESVWFPETSQQPTTSKIELYPVPYENANDGNFKIQVPISCYAVRIGVKALVSAVGTSLAMTAKFNQL
jgi:hypothetical protein